MGGDDVSLASADATSENSGRAAVVVTKQLLAARKKHLKLLKSKDVSKKLEALTYCLEDDGFVREPGVLPLIVGFLAKTKAVEVVHATLETIEKLLTVTSADVAATAGIPLGETTLQHSTLSDTNARFIIVQCTQPDSPWQGGTPFLAVLAAKSLSPDIKIQAINVYCKLLQAAVALAVHDTSYLDALAVIQTAGDPRGMLQSLLDATNSDVQFAALTCLKTLLPSFVDHTLFVSEDSDAEQQQQATTRCLAFAMHPEPRFHAKMLAIVESVSQSEPGRAFLRAQRASKALKNMLVTISESTASASTTDDRALVAANTSAIATCFCRLECAKEQFATISSSDDAQSTNDHDSVVLPAIDALVLLLQRDVASALAPLPASLTTGTPVPVANSPATNAAATNAPAPTPALIASDTCIAIITVLGRMAQRSDNCKAHAKERGVMVTLLDCFKMRQGDDDNNRLHQVADTLLHICTEVPGGSNSDKLLGVDPRVFAATVHDDNDNSTSDSTDATELSLPVVTERPAFVSPDVVTSLLEAAKATDDTQLVFRIVRWLATVVQAAANARALGNSSNIVSVLVKLLHENPMSNRLLVGFLAQCIGAIVEQSSSACESCGSDGCDPTAALVTFLHSSSAATDNLLDICTDIDDDNSVATQPTSVLELCALEWLDDAQAQAIFAPICLAHLHHDVDPFVCAVDALQALVRAFFKWNPPLQADASGTSATATVDVYELLLQRLDAAAASSSTSSSGATTSATTSAAKVSVAAPSKKKIDIPRIASLVGESVVCSVLEKSVELLQLLSFVASDKPCVSTGIVRLTTQLMALPGGINAMLHLAKLQATSESSSAASDTEKTADVPATTPAVTQFVDWPLSANELASTVFACLVRPFLHVLQINTSTFSEIDAAIVALDVLTSADVASTVVYTVTLPAAVTDATTVDVPITLCDVFTSVAASAGALVWLLAFTDVCRLSDAPVDAVHRDAFTQQARALASRFITQGTKLHDAAAAKHTTQQSANNADSSSSDILDSTSVDQLPASTPLCTHFATRWAASVLDLRVDVPRFAYASYSAIVLAAELSDTTSALQLLAAGASSNTVAADGTGALLLALLTGNDALVAALLQHGTDVDAMTTDGSDLCAWSCALVAPLNHNVSALITHSYNAGSSILATELLVQLDTIHGRAAVLRELLATNVDVNVSNADGDYLLHALVSKLLVRKRVRGRDICSRYDTSPQRPHAAFWSPSPIDVLATVTSLLGKHGANVDACNMLGQTALHVALLFGHADAVTCLLQHGANPNVRDRLGYLPLHYACLGFCTSRYDASADASAAAVAVVQALLDAGTVFELMDGKYVDLRKHRRPHEKRALEIERILEDGFANTIAPKALTTNAATPAQLLATRGHVDGLLPWHFACGACNATGVPTLCLDDGMTRQFSRNGAVRAAILTFLQTTAALKVDLSMHANKRMTALHFALKTDNGGANTAVIDVLLATACCRAQLNDVHDAMTIDSLPPVLEGSLVDVSTASIHAMRCYVSSRSFDGTYHVILPNGTHMERVRRDEIQPTEAIGRALVTPAGGCMPKHLHIAESAFSALHYAVQTSDTLSLRLLALPDISLTPDGSDVPLLELARAARRSARVIAMLEHQQTNVFDATHDGSTNQIVPCSLLKLLHAEAVQFGTLNEGVGVDTALMATDEHMEGNKCNQV